VHPELAGWLPHQLERDGDRTVCRWRYVGATPFTAPFFEDTIQQCLVLPENSFGPPMVTGLDVLVSLAAEVPALDPSAFIFHVSRCGSTLVSQLLSEDPAFVSLSEVAFFDQLLRARFQAKLADAVEVAKLLPAALRIHGKRRTGFERFLFVKLDSWHVGFHAELRALYPETPFILLYRHPAAVIRSHATKPGMHAVRGLIEPALFGWSAEEIADLQPTAYLSRVLEFYYESFLRIARTDPRSLLVHYEAGIIEAVESIAQFAGTPLQAGHRERMQARAGFHGKNPDEIFREAPISGPSIACPPACLARYEALERFRAGSIDRNS
jgi:hypothetical protein